MTVWRVAALLCLVAGCSSKPELYHVSGTVTHDGQPVPAGEIKFEADVTKGHDGPQGFARIKDGKYDTSQRGRGVLGGPYVIRIDGFDGKPNGELPFGKPLFNTYRESRDLPKQVSQQDFAVPVKESK